MTNKKPVYLAIDSDILRTITLLDILKKEYPRVEIEKIKDITLKKDFNYFMRLYNAINNDEIRLLIVEAVYQESKHSSSLIEFMKNYCYFPNVNAVNYQEKAQKARELAYAYTEQQYTYIDNNGKEIIADPPMIQRFTADINNYVPTNDCYIMAQATIENCSLLTNNGKDFIFDKRDENKYNHSKVKGITAINIAKGYYSETYPGHYVTPKPIMLKTIAASIKYDDFFETVDQKDNYVKADTIL